MLVYLGTFSCKMREIDEKVPNCFAVGLNTPPSIYVGLNSLIEIQPSDIPLFCRP